MSNLILAVTYADVPGFAPGTTVGSVVATLVGAVNTTPVTQSSVTEADTITFVNVPADTYSYTVQALDANANPLGVAVVGSFTLTAPATITLSLPASVAASQA